LAQEAKSANFLQYFWSKPPPFWVKLWRRYPPKVLKEISRFVSKAETRRKKISQKTCAIFVALDQQNYRKSLKRVGASVDDIFALHNEHVEVGIQFKYRHEKFHIGFDFDKICNHFNNSQDILKNE
jgi:hypothetical protein